MPDNQSILFLDIDGVLATKRTYLARDSRPYPLCLIDSDCVAALNVLLGLAAPEIVISSTWRHGLSRKQFAKLMADAGISGILHPDWRTTEMRYQKRGEEVARWLHLRRPVARYVILDDDDDFLPGQHLVRTTFDTGFAPLHVPLAMRFLRTEV